MLQIFKILFWIVQVNIMIILIYDAFPELNKKLKVMIVKRLTVMYKDGYGFSKKGHSKDLKRKYKELDGKGYVRSARLETWLFGKKIRERKLKND